MSLLHRFSKDATENIYGVHEGDTIKITSMKDPISRKGDIANLDTLTSWAVLKDGEWHEKEDFSDDNGMSVAPFLSDVDDDTIITCIDYHM